MSLPARLLLSIIAVALLATLLPGVDTRGQVTLPLRNEPAAASAESQAIAHGMVAHPVGKIGWRVVVRRAVLPHRASPQTGPARFILAQEGAVALTDADGTASARLAPGEAAWLEADTAYAVVSLEDRAVDYVEIALRPAANLGDGGQSLAIGLPFAAPEGAAFPLNLLRGVLERDAEITLPAGATPSLLLVTRGAVWATLATGETVQLTTGAVAQVEGDVVVAGASRTPVAFVVARADDPLPERFALKNATPASASAPQATPVGAADGVESTAVPTAVPMDADADGDGLPDAAEAMLGTDPAATDGDGDGLTDRDESEFYGTDPLAADTDGDGVDDGGEVLVFGANPLLADTDGDGAADGAEIAAGTDPLDAASLPLDETATPSAVATPAADAAGPPAAIASPESEPETTPTVVDTAEPGDRDGDGLATSDEIGIYGTDPAVVDSDGDGFSDGGEVVAGTDPLDPLSPP